MPRKPRCRPYTPVMFEWMDAVENSTEQGRPEELVRVASKGARTQTIGFFVALEKGWLLTASDRYPDAMLSHEEATVRVITRTPWSLVTKFHPLTLED